MKKALVFILLASVLIGVIALKIHNSHLRAIQDYKLLNEKNDLESEGRKLEKQGMFESAADKYRQAADMDKVIYGSDKGRSLAFLAETYQKMGQYSEALRIVEELIKAHLKQKNYYEWREELQALLDFQENVNVNSMRLFITDYAAAHSVDLPPQHFGFGSISYINRILYLYNHIGDHDAGIKLIDDCIAYFKLQDIEKYGEYHSGKNDLEYLKVRKGFERDKTEGFKGCAGAKPGEVCMGHATHALIQSDYFPW